MQSSIDFGARLTQYCHRTTRMILQGFSNEKYAFRNYNDENMNRLIQNSQLRV